MKRKVERVTTKILLRTIMWKLYTYQPIIGGFVGAADLRVSVFQVLQNEFVFGVVEPVEVESK